MKKAISLLLAIFVICTAFAGCTDGKTQLKIYFKDSLTNELCEETRSVDVEKNPNELDLAIASVEQIIAGPQNEKNVPVISPDAKLLSLTISEGVATVNMSKHFLEKSGVDALVQRFAFVNTLCSIDGIDGIVIQVEGNPLLSESTGKELGVLSISDIALNKEDKTTISLYFPNNTGEKLVLDRRTVDAQQTLSLEKTIVSELIKGPSGKSLSPSIPDGTKLIGIETKDNVCYVNFSSEFCTKASSGTTATTFTLYSVVNSLCMLDNVSSVQILINGETGVEFGNYVLDIPYEFNADLVG